ncbi:ABC transporter substrate-binding protein [Sphingomonas quercus]|uniref:ABC transporter substrate-binding protein n=1 Tax=Sphingomonas quercus TaxID=2842451 RepID=A0ABS6BMN0_9SPHN|nr:ABC transporter substrate-binding protein [Sphingomonas quercus]MBU3079444.1 ABC transporter substrate-binding protein [Sphingomonas quercus]
MRPILAFTLFGAAIPALAQAQAPDAARAPVQALSDGLIGIMQGGQKMGFAGRSAAIAPIIDRSFDLAMMTRVAVGPAWTGLSAADQAALVAAFRKMTIAEYAGNFDSFGGQKFTIDPNVEVRGADRLVRTSLVQPGEAPVAIAYRLRSGANGWRIVDVFYRNAISQLATRRADFSRVMANGGARALIGHLNDLAAKAAA